MERKCCHPRRHVSSLHWEALPDPLVLNLLVTAQNYLNSKCYAWFAEALQPCEIAFVGVTNGYLSPFRV